MNENLENPGLKKSVLWLYFTAATSLVVGSMIAMVYLIFYITDRMLITAVIMGVVMLLARIFDLIIGVLTGVIIQKFSLKHGQFRTWLLYGPFIGAIGTTLCFFNPHIPIIAKAVIVFIGYLLYGGGNSFIQLAQNGLMSKIAGPSMEYRIAITAKITQGQQAGNFIGSLITMPLIMLVDSMGMDGYAVIQVILAVLGVIGQLPLFFMTKKYDEYDPNFRIGNNATVKLGAMFSGTLKNGQLIILLLADAFRQTSFLSVMALGIYYFTYVAKNPGMLTVAMTAQSIGALLGSFAGQPIAKKIGKKNSALLSAFLCFVFYTGIALFGETGPIVYIVCTAAALFSLGIINSCGANLYLDCGEYQLYKTGRDNRPFTLGFFGISFKLGFTLSSVAIAILLEASGYNGATNTVSNSRLMGQLIGGILAGLNVFYFLVMLIYGISEEKSREYAEHNFKESQRIVKNPA
jgi:Na+/melibiose symporter-like transporter